MGKNKASEQTKLNLPKRVDTEGKLVKAVSILLLESWMVSCSDIPPYSEQIIQLVRNYDKGQSETCLRCNKRTAQFRDALEWQGVFRGQPVYYEAPGYLCLSCGFRWNSGEQEGEHDRAKKRGDIKRRSF